MDPAQLRGVVTATSERHHCGSRQRYSRTRGAQWSGRGDKGRRPAEGGGGAAAAQIAVDIDEASMTVAGDDDICSGSSIKGGE